MSTIQIKKASGVSQIVVTPKAARKLKIRLSGTQGPANQLSIGSVTDGPTADATITGSAPSQTLNLVLPQSQVPGPPGPPNELTIGTVSEGPADASITGSAPSQTLNLTLPKGGDGAAATIAVGTVTTVGPSDPATVTNSGTSSAAVLDFEIPQGLDGADGALWFAGSSDPSSGTGENGDFYLQTGNGSTGIIGDVWEKAAGSWSIVGNIRGASGSGTGDMLAATYDPQNIAGDAFDRSKHTGDLPETALRAGLRASLTTESTDADNLTTTGTYVLNGVSAANSPSAHYYYVIVFGGANVGQLACGVSSQDIYYRQRVGSWSAWRRVSSATLAAISALSVTDGNFIVGNGSTWVAESGSTARASLGLGDAATKAVGTGSNDVAAGDHTHSDATTSIAGFMSASDKSKLDGIASGATANTGTVTSVGASVPTGLSISGSPITTSGTFAVTWAAGYQGYTSAEASKLSGIETGADVTDATNVAAAGAAMLATENQALTGGATVTIKDLGNLSGTTKTIDVGDRPIQKITNNGAGTISPGSVNGSCYVEVINASGAGAVTTSGFTKVEGSFDTTSTSKFLCGVTVTPNFSALQILKVA